MQYSPKLKKAASEIKAILKKHDIAGAVILHAPGFGEYLIHLDTSYSCARLEGRGLRIKTHGRTHEHKEATANMIGIFSEISGQNLMAFDAIDKELQKRLGAEHGDGKWTGQDEIDN